MDWLNYHHLLYFWVVAREGTIARACDQLHLTQPAISKQLRQLERSVGQRLFKRAGRNLVLTETGQEVFRYAEEIFSLGQELAESLQGKPRRSRPRLSVGIADVLPKLLAYRLLEPVLHLPEPVQLVCDERGLVDLLAELAQYRLDVVLSDSPLSPTVSVRAYNHLLGECGVSILGSSSLARKFRRGFPQSLDEAPFLLPTPKSMLRRSLDQWFDSEGIRPDVRGEFDDSALLKVFGQAGQGLFAVPSAVEQETCRQYRVQLVGRLDAVRERFYAISVERRLRHPAVKAITEAAHGDLFREG
ncbi:MAG: transcriptional activator NhaR [Pirellulales bacterium]|nr:transcriptional activator NhaR [Pirellulales bacterium]